MHESNYSMAAAWDARYANTKQLWSDKPNPDLEYLIRWGNEEALALDVGAGEGRNSFALAERGFTVRAIDISAVAIERLQAISTDLNLSVAAEVADISNMTLPKCQYGIIVCDMVLQLLPSQAWNKVFQEYHAALKPEGLLYIRTFSTQDPTCPEHPHGKNWHFFSKAELLDLLAPLSILRSCEEFTLDDTHDAPHYHGLISVVAKKTT